MVFFFLTIKRVFKKRLLTNTPKSISVLFVSLIRHWITQIIFGVECPCVMYDWFHERIDLYSENLPIEVQHKKTSFSALKHLVYLY